VNGKSEVRTASPTNGHVIDLGAGHSIAIYERNGVSWVAEFRDGRGEIMYAGAWFRLDSRCLRYCHDRRTGLQPSTPLTPDMLDNIERLHVESEARQKRILALPRIVALVARRYWISLISRRRRRGVKTRQTFV
jgi:hypothetical protein